MISKFRVSGIYIAGLGWLMPSVVLGVNVMRTGNGCIFLADQRVILGIWCSYDAGDNSQQIMKLDQDKSDKDTRRGLYSYLA